MTRTARRQLKHLYCKCTGEIGYDLTKTKQNSTYKPLVVAMKINSFFQTLSLFPDFFKVWKIAGQISILFQEFKTLYDPCEM